MVEHVIAQIFMRRLDKVFDLRVAVQDRLDRFLGLHWLLGRINLLWRRCFVAAVLHHLHDKLVLAIGSFPLFGSRGTLQYLVGYKSKYKFFGKRDVIRTFRYRPTLV